MAGSDKHERTEKPTAKRRREARKDGQVARSPELLAWLSLLAGSYVLQMTVRNGYGKMSQLLATAAAAAGHPDTAGAMGVLRTGLTDAVSVAAPLVFTMMALGVAGNLAQVGLTPTFRKLKPDFSHLSPLKGIKRMASPMAAWEAAKQLIKVALLGVVVWRTVSGALPVLVGSGPMSVFAVAADTAGEALSSIRLVAGIGLVIAAVDYMLQRRRVARMMRMTRQEVKEENKDSDGNPLVKGAIRRKQRQLSRMLMIAAVASADAVVVNPTHVAVALRYEPGRGAPRVVARGADHLAQRIKAEARDHGVPMVQDIPLARTLYATCRLDQEIPADLYEAVARLLTFIYALRRDGRAVRVDGNAHLPPAPLLRSA